MAGCKALEGPAGPQQTVMTMETLVEICDGYALELLLNKHDLDAPEHAALEAMQGWGCTSAEAYTPGGTHPHEGRVSYAQRAQGGWGRLCPADRAGLAHLRHDVCHALCRDHADKLTLVDAELVALRCVAKKHGWDCSQLDTLCTTPREDLLAELQQAYGLERPRQAEGLVFKQLYTAGLPIGHKAPTQDMQAGLTCGGGGRLRLPARTPDSEQLYNLAKLGEELRDLAHRVEKQYPGAAAQAREERATAMVNMLDTKGSPTPNLPASGTALGLVVETRVSQMVLAMVAAAKGEGRKVATLAADAIYLAGKGKNLPGLAAACQQAVEQATGGMAVQVMVDPMSTSYTLEVLEGRLPAELIGLGLVPLGSPKDSQLELPLARMLEVLLGEQLRVRMRHPGAKETMYAYRPCKGYWEPVELKDAATVMLDIYMDWYTSPERKQVPAEYLNAATHEHMLSTKGSTAVLGFLKRFLHDPGFIPRLDSAITERGLLPFTNVCAAVDATRIRLVPHSHEHYFSQTIGYALPPDESKVDYTAVDSWWATYWEGSQKRQAVMKTIAAALLPRFRSKHKQITVGTDRADGNTGKSVLWRVLRKVLDILALPLQPTMVYDAASLGSRNGHGANELSYRGVLLACLDEMKVERKFDMEALKKLAGGGIEFHVRMIHSSKTVDFPWMAMPLLLCNSGCLPEMDSSSAVDMGRFRFICFEVRFEAPTGAAVPDSFDPKLVKKAEDAVVEKMQEHRGAHMWRLLQAAHELARDHGGALSDAEWPEDWRLLKQEAAEEADPLAGIVAGVVSRHVVKGAVVKEGEPCSVGPDGEPILAKQTIVDHIQRTDLSHIVAFEARQSNIRPTAAEVKGRLDAHMALQGYKFVVDTTRHGVKVKASYLGCKMAASDDPCNL